MARQIHASKVGRVIGVLDELAAEVDDGSGGTYSAAADILREYAETLTHDVDIDRPANLAPHHYRSALVLLCGQQQDGDVRTWASPAHRRVLQRAVGLLEQRLSNGGEN